MKSNTQRVTTLILDEDEADWLREIMLNELKGRENITDKKYKALFLDGLAINNRRISSDMFS